VFGFLQQKLLNKAVQHFFYRADVLFRELGMLLAYLYNSNRFKQEMVKNYAGKYISNI
jgi:hypothetical protein